MRFGKIGSLAALAVLLAAGAAHAAASSGRHAAVTCDTTAGGVAVVPLNVSRRGLLLYNNGATTIFVGQGAPSALSTTNGMPIPVGASLTIIDYQGPLSCIVAAGSENLRVLEVAN